MSGSNRMITVRDERRGDLPGIQEVEASAIATLRRTYRPTRAAMACITRLNNLLFRLVALMDNRIVGSVQYRMEGRTMRITGLGVHSDFRRLGVTRALFQALESIGMREKATRLHLHTVKQTGNVAVFKRLGFTAISETADTFSESDWYDWLTDVEMEKQLPHRKDGKP